MNEPSHQANAAGLSKADQNINNTAEDISHAASGHKANISNPSMWDACIFLPHKLTTPRHKPGVKGEVKASIEGTRW